MTKDRRDELADWLRYTEDPDYIFLPTTDATTKETPVAEEREDEDYL